MALVAWLTTALRFLWAHPAVAIAGGLTLWAIGEDLSKRDRPGGALVAGVGQAAAGLGAVALVPRAIPSSWGVYLRVLGAPWRGVFW